MHTARIKHAAAQHTTLVMEAPPEVPTPLVLAAFGYEVVGYIPEKSINEVFTKELPPPPPSIRRGCELR